MTVIDQNKWKSSCLPTQPSVMQTSGLLEELLVTWGDLHKCLLLVVEFPSNVIIICDFTPWPAGVLFDTTTRATIKPRLKSKLKRRRVEISQTTCPWNWVWKWWSMFNGTCTQVPPRASCSPPRSSWSELPPSLLQGSRSPGQQVLSLLPSILLYVVCPLKIIIS